jgi:hypothetical protein
MAGHQTIRPDLQRGAAAPLIHQVRIPPAIGLREKGLHSAITASGYAMGDVGDNSSCHARHGKNAISLSLPCQ